MISIESTAKTVQKAIEDGLEKLQMTIDEVDIKIISSGGIFKKAKVEITVQTLDKPQTEKTEAKPVSDLSKPVDKQGDKRENRQEDRRENRQEGRKDNRREDKDTQNQPEQRQEKQSAPQPAKAAQAVQKQPQQRNFDKPVDRQMNRPVDKDKQVNQSKDNLPKEQHEVKRDKPAPKPQAKVAREDDGTRPERAKNRQEEHHRERPRTEVTPEIVQDATAFVEELLGKMAVDFALTTKIENGELTVNIECGNGAVIGYRGETLDSIEYLTSLVINKSDDKYYRINIDCNDYRSKRVETLSALARRMAEKAVKTGRKVVLEPMSSSSRKIIHSILSENDRIITRSEGKDPTRRIIIIPKRFK